MRGFLSFFGKVTKAKEIPTFTHFLVNNPVFRRVVLAFHKEKTETINDIDEYLEKELLTKEQYDAKYNAKRLNGDKKGQNRQ